MNNNDARILMLINDDRRFEEGFSLLVSSYQEKLYWHIRRMVHFHEDADDVLQNTFIKVFKHIKGFKSDSRLYTWLYRIASNESINHLQKQKKHASTDLGAHLTDLGERLKADSYFDAEQAQIILAQAIESLPEKQRVVFNMRYFDELSYKDIAEILETSVGALKASFHHAMKKVESYITDNIDYVEG
ncbi:MAG: RNA polymerase sigma factor [Saprospiraceae bacterium]|nr:RNA polymerase sigma factor [Saprospiraceae bacterium]